jgi:hypothetical protein
MPYQSIVRSLLDILLGSLLDILLGSLYHSHLESPLDIYMPEQCLRPGPERCIHLEELRFPHDAVG